MGIGHNINKIRKERNLTISAVAEMAGVTTSLISQIENDKANPSLTTLLQIAKALGVDAGAFFGSQSESSNNPVTRVSERPIISKSNGWTVFALNRPESNRLDVQYNVMDPGATSVHSPEMNVEGQVGLEFMYVVKGTMKVELDGELYVLNTGDSIQFKASKKHILSNPTSAVTEVLWVALPNEPEDIINYKEP